MLRGPKRAPDLGAAEVRLDPDLAALYDGIERYYSEKVKRYGATPLGVDWSCVPTQELRFLQLLKLCDFSGPFALDDLGCGYGALLAYLDHHHAGAAIDYLGIDISPAMIRRAKRLWRQRPRTAFIVGNASSRAADYAVASGIFNVMEEQPRALWERFIATTLTQMQEATRRGFAVNFMLPLADDQMARSGLYRTSREPWLEFCKKKLNAAVELVEGYGMREFTLLVRRRAVS